jgi:hypothetical protein
MNEKRKRNERTLHTNDTKNARYKSRTLDTRTNEMKHTENANKQTHDTRNNTRKECTIYERTNHWSVTIYYPMTKHPSSIELTNLIFYTQLIYINDKLVGKVIV